MIYSKAMVRIGADSKFDAKELDEVNRNWIMHGRTNKIYTRLDGVRILNMIYGTIRLGELGREDANKDELDGKKTDRY